MTTPRSPLPHEIELRRRMERPPAGDQHPSYECKRGHARRKHSHDLPYTVDHVQLKDSYSVQRCAPRGHRRISCFSSVALKNVRDDVLSSPHRTSDPGADGGIVRRLTRFMMAPLRMIPNA